METDISKVSRAVLERAYQLERHRCSELRKLKRQGTQLHSEIVRELLIATGHERIAHQYASHAEFRTQPNRDGCTTIYVRLVTGGKVFGNSYTVWMGTHSMHIGEHIARMLYDFDRVIAGERAF